MRKANVFVNNDLAGVLTENTDGSYLFCYTDDYLGDSTKTAISLTLPKSKKEYYSPTIFPFFFNMLPEGVNKQVQTGKCKIDENDYFGLLLAVAHNDTIGAITIKQILEPV